MVKFILLLGDEPSNHADYSDPKVTFSTKECAFQRP
nr:MAG TPA: hypothetical protein [Caudoviricetes sp.]